MIARNIISRNPALITASDFDRLKDLVESPRYRRAGPIPLAPLRRELQNGEVIAQTLVPKDVVTMRSRVRVHDVRTKELETYTLVYPDEANLDEGKLSVMAPMGTALIGAREGSVVSFDAPGGRRRLKIVKVLYQPEAAGDFHL